MVVSEWFPACADARAYGGLSCLSLASGLGACSSLGAGSFVPSEPFMPYTNAPWRSCAGCVQTVASAASLRPPRSYAWLQSYATARFDAGSQNRQSAGRYKVGAPYQSGGVWYVPAEQPNYDETGLASWYGDAFDGKPTANGELFDMHGDFRRARHLAHALHGGGDQSRKRPHPAGAHERSRSLSSRAHHRPVAGRGGPTRLLRSKGTAKVRVRYVGPASLDAGSGPLTFASTSMSNRCANISPPPARQPTHSPCARPSYQTAQSVASAPAANPSAGAGRYAVQAGAFSSRTDRRPCGPQPVRRPASARVSQPLHRQRRRPSTVSLLGPWN